MRSHKSWSKAFIPRHCLTNFAMQEDYQNEPKFIVFIQEMIYQKSPVFSMKHSKST